MTRGDKYYRQFSNMKNTEITIYRDLLFQIIAGRTAIIQAKDETYSFAIEEMPTEELKKLLEDALKNRS